MIESSVILVISKKNIIHNYNYLINRKYNKILKKFMKNIVRFQKKNYIYFLNVKNLNNYLTNNFNIFREKKLTSLANKVERKFD